MAKIVVTTATKAVRRSGDVGLWVYIGTDAGRRARLAQRLGAGTLLALGGRLHEVAERLRQPFLDFVARTGVIQRDRIGWWSSAFAWKVTGASDLFLLVVYEHLIVELCYEFVPQEVGLLVVVEDPWLYRQMQEVLRDRHGVLLEARVRLWPRRLRAVVAGVVKRGWWAARIVLSRVKQRWYWRRARGPAAPGAADVAVYSLPLRRALQGEEGWSDPFLGDLDQLLQRHGYSVGRFSPPEAFGFERAVAFRNRYLWPLVLDVSVRDFLRSLMALWHFVPPRALQVGRLGVDWLIRREWWQEVGRATLFLNRVFLECARRFLRRGIAKVVVFPYENQPWEKLLILAARDCGVKTVAYQHGGGMPRFMLSYFLGTDESEVAPVPDVVVTSGPHSHRVLAEGGTPAPRLVMAGSWRYRALQGIARRHATESVDAACFARVLVSLPITRDIARHLLAAIRAAFPDGGSREGLRFVIKAHPGNPVNPRAVGFDAEIADGTFAEALDGCALAVYAGSSTGMEALIAGRRVLRYRSELLINVDHGDVLDDGVVPTCDDRDLRERLLALVRGVQARGELAPFSGGLLGNVFAPIDESAWIKVFQGLLTDRADAAEALHG